MSHQALQRMVVRLLYDPALVDRLRREGARALAPSELSTVEQEWLLRVDPRAFGTDPLRRHRSLTDLVAEYPVASALALDVAGLPALDAFFSGELFHEGRRQGRSLALDFGGHLLDLGGAHGDAQPWLAPAARLERSLARLRRPHARRPTPRGKWSLHPRCELVALPRHGLAAHQAVRARLDDGDLVASVLDPRRRHALVLPAVGEGEDRLLVSVDEGGGARIEPLSAELFALLDAARGGADRDELEGVCRALGAESDQIGPLLEDFVQGGELVPPSS